METHKKIKQEATLMFELAQKNINDSIDALYKDFPEAKENLRRNSAPSPDPDRLP